MDSFPKGKLGFAVTEVKGTVDFYNYIYSGSLIIVLHNNYQRLCVVKNCFSYMSYGPMFLYCYLT